MPHDVGQALAAKKLTNLFWARRGGSAADHGG
jgi:hypothetical protein